eukprot:TRINITY_DN6658_c0_g1_i1.p1 TRINITY_DN6658_c0_g1~~TRINITY_DN6658_c0_g1_i1.p1  ORF type:complete len:166 (-),score=24.41 TRINITY_DN6658_c0_g1_i1:129-626(-)
MSMIRAKARKFAGAMGIKGFTESPGWYRSMALRVARDHGADTHIRNLNILVRFLPPRTTSEIQPCDMWHIASLKAHWRSVVADGMSDADSEAALASAQREFGTERLMRTMVAYCEGLERERDTVEKYWHPVLGGGAGGVDYEAAMQREIDLWEQRFVSKDSLWDE